MSERDTLIRQWDRADPAERLKIERRLEGPPLPYCLRHLWEWFGELAEARGGGMGPSPIGYQDIAAWAKLTGRRPTPWEVSVIRQLDGLWLSIMPDQNATSPPLVDEDGELDHEAIGARLERALALFG